MCPSKFSGALMKFWMLLLVHLVLLQQSNYGCFACVEEERNALLDIRAAFNNYERINANSYYLYKSWNESTMECCSWDGVHCSPTTKHVRSLELHDSFGDTLNVSLFLPFRELQSLILSYNRFNICIPSDCFSSLAKLQSLEYLDLSWNYFDSKALSSLAALGSLKALSLEQFWTETGSFDVQKQSQMTSELFINVSEALSRLSKLTYLQLSYNLLNTSIIPYLGGISSLKTLNLTNNNMQGCLHLIEFSKLNNLVELDLAENNFTGVCPFMVKEWTSLRRLYIDGNKFNGTSLKGLCKIKNLEELSISRNNMKGNIPVCFGHLSSIIYIDISYNQLGTLFPSSIIRNLTLLKYAIFSDNNFDGIISIDLFSNNTALKVMDLSNNYQLEVQTQHLGMMPPFQLSEISLSNCILNKSSSFIPAFLSNQYMIEYIDLSSTGLEDNIPPWLFENKTRLSGLNLRNNSFRGQLIFPSNKTNLLLFDISNNKLTGEIPNNIGDVLLDIAYLRMSHNFLQGAIPSSFGNLYNVKFVDLSYNHLSGVLPSCIKNLSNLIALNIRENKLEGNLTSGFCHLSNIEYLDLSKNNFSGLVPSCINMPFLQYLNLNGNRLIGSFPNAILGSPLIIALDMGNNNFKGNIPSKMWENLSNLKIISLDGNYFEGELSGEICQLQYLRVLDLSRNKLHGKIPSCLHHMGSSESVWLEVIINIGYKSSKPNKEFFWHHINGELSSAVTAQIGDIRFSTKRRSDSYEGDILNYLSGLDLSENQFDGKIPEMIGEMTWLQALNFSNNRLTGPIPPTFSRLTNIESLDLSHNMLIGRIPSQLVELHFLQVFSVAYNNLSGPTLGMVSQFSTFDERSYEGNPYLCGPPLVKKCTSMVPSLELFTNDHDDEAIDHIMFFGSFALGFIIGFWGWMALLYFKRSWQYSFSIAIDKYMNEAFDMASNLLLIIKSLW